MKSQNGTVIDESALPVEGDFDFSCFAVPPPDALEERQPAPEAQAAATPHGDLGLDAAFDELVPVLAAMDHPRIRQAAIDGALRRTRKVFREAFDAHIVSGEPYVSLIRAICRAHSRCLICDRTSYFGIEEKIRRCELQSEAGRVQTRETILVYTTFLEKADVEEIELTIPIVWDGTPCLRAGFIGEVYRANGWFARRVKEADRRRIEYSISSFKWQNFGGIPVFVTSAEGPPVRLKERFQPSPKTQRRSILQFFNKLDAAGQVDASGFTDRDRIKSEVFSFALGAVITEYLARFPGESERFIPLADESRLGRGMQRAEDVRDRRD